MLDEHNPQDANAVIRLLGGLEGFERAPGTSDGKILLPGGISESCKHDTMWGIGNVELAEKTGLSIDYVSLIPPRQIKARLRWECAECQLWIALPRFSLTKLHSLAPDLIAR